jgi:hypothetical protein
MKSQLAVVIENNRGKLINVKFNGNEGVTNWLSITEEQFKKVQAILIAEGE